MASERKPGQRRLQLGPGDVLDQSAHVQAGAVAGVAGRVLSQDPVGPDEAMGRQQRDRPGLTRVGRRFARVGRGDGGVEWVADQVPGRLPPADVLGDPGLTRCRVIRFPGDLRDRRRDGVDPRQGDGVNRLARRGERLVEALHLRRRALEGIAPKRLADAHGCGKTPAHGKKSNSESD